MKKLLPVFFLFIFFSIAKAQNLPQCDSLIIQCCTFDSVAPNTLTIYVSNPSSVLFDYPNFTLFELSWDTVANEQVTYFGIGTWPQEHTLTISTPLSLPFTGYLNLYTLFGDSLCCSWPFYIPDTVTGISKTNHDASITIYPNPSNGQFTVSAPGEIRNSEINIYDIQQRKVYSQLIYQQSATINHKFSSGIYFLEISSRGNQILRREKLVIQ
jgi:hypothetical protein